MLHMNQGSVFVCCLVTQPIFEELCDQVDCFVVMLTSCLCGGTTILGAVKSSVYWHMKTVGRLTSSTASCVY